MLALCGLLVLSMAALSNSAALDLTILHINDDHSHLSGEFFDLKGSKVPAGLSVSTNDVRVDFGGYPRLVTLISQLKSAAQGLGHSVLKLHGGDTMTGTSYYSLFKGTADAEMMSKVCFDAFTLGNHEFDDGDGNLATFIDALQSYDSVCPDTPVISANVNPGASSPLVGKLQKSVTKTFNGEKVGIIGIDVKIKTELASSPDPGTTLSDEKTSAQAEIASLIANGVNKIILLTHIGYTLDQSWWSTLSGVDVVVGGDSHSLLGDANSPSTAVSAYPTIATNADGEKMCIVQAWEYAHGVGELKVSFDASGVVTSCSGSPKFPIDGTRFIDVQNNAELNSADVTVVKNHLEAFGQYVAVAEDASTSAALATYSDQVDALKTQVIATVPSNICFDRFPGQGRSLICSAAATHAQGGPACNLVALAFLMQTKTADIAIQQAGGCRTDIAAGDFTYDSAYKLLPFDNTIMTFEMTGAQIKLLLEEALDFGLASSSGAYPYASGLRFDINLNNTKGSRLTNLEVNSRLAGSWVSISSTASYTVATNNYLGRGKDGYVTFTSVAASAVNTYTEYAQCFIDYARTAQTLVAPADNVLSTQAYTDVKGASHGAGSRPLGTQSYSEVNGASHGAWHSIGAAWLVLSCMLLVRQ